MRNQRSRGIERKGYGYSYSYAENSHRLMIRGVLLGHKSGFEGGYQLSKFWLTSLDQKGRKWLLLGKMQ